MMTTLSDLTNGHYRIALDGAPVGFVVRNGVGFQFNDREVWMDGRHVATLSDGGTVYDGQGYRIADARHRLVMLTLKRVAVGFWPDTLVHHNDRLSGWGGR